MRLHICLLLCLATACGASDTDPKAATDASSEAANPALIERQVRDLISALTPASATANSAVRSDWQNRRREVMKELSAAGPALGQAVLDAFHDKPDVGLDVRRGLLEVAALNLPQQTSDELAGLVMEYGEDLGLRTKACEILALTNPQLAMQVIEPLIIEPRPGLTLPPAEIMVTSFGVAARGAGVQPVDVFSTIAANLFAEQTARLMAIKELAKIPGARSRETLKIVLIESTGNHFLRRGSGQALVAHAKVDPDTKSVLCNILTDAMNKEADINFQIFLVNMLAKHCE